MFEITAADIALLDDEKLREVVARLCEAELRLQGLSSVHVIWGGHQNAGDGGIDVKVDMPPGTEVNGFIPRAATGFQVKRQDMSAAEISSEMRPKGVLRPSIQALADHAGAYIIVSSKGSLAGSALKSRCEAMTAAVQDARNANALAVDFYDRTRIAQWVQNHVGLIPWVRERVGRRLQGWHSYGSWANLSEPLSAEYLVDEKLRLHTSSSETDKGLSALDGIRNLRDKLRAARSVVRLVGLSGVGKTRLVQALFDDRIGDCSLDPAAAIYSDIGGEGPDPPPVALASHLVLTCTKAILVVDNCGADLHKRLSEICRRPESTVSLITIQYDIQDDQPEGTEVFRLDTSSPKLIERLLHLRFPRLSEVDARTITEASDGNARVAIALAATVGPNDTVAGLNDRQLFERLFFQRQSPNDKLYRVAQACSLLYSFNGEDLSNGDGAELVRLGRLVEMTPAKIYGYVANLQERGLVQKRGPWRAVLPHAIANRLAPIALKSIPNQTIEQQLLSTERLMASFARRIGYLHKSAEAAQIVKRWLAPGGLLANIAEFDDLGCSMLNRVAPVAPDLVLDALERACNQQPAKCDPYLDLLRSLAYDPHRFARSIELLVRVVAAGNPDESSHGRDVFESLFQMRLSGTHAPIERRLEILESLLNSPDPKRQTLGVRGLRAVLEASHYASVSQFDFGARPRDYGYWPSSFEETRHWFISALSLIERFALGDVAVTPQMRTLLADSFCGVWSRGCICAELASLCQRIGDQRFWPEGWLAVRHTLQYDSNSMSVDLRTRLATIEQLLRPSDLSQKVRAIVFSTRHHGIGFDEFEDDASDDFVTRRKRTLDLIRSLGVATANDDQALTELLPEIVNSDGDLRLFGTGLQAGATDQVELWNRLVAAYTATAEGQRRRHALGGFLQGLHAANPSIADNLLDQSLEHGALAPIYPFLQAAVPIDQNGVARLNRSLALGKTPIRMYVHLGTGGASDPIPAAELNRLLLAIAELPDGYDVAIELLVTRVHLANAHKQVVASELLPAGCELLRRLTFTKHDSRDYDLGLIATACLTGELGAAVTRELCGRLKTEVAAYRTYSDNYQYLLCGLFRVQPLAALDALCGGSAEELNRGARILRECWRRENPISLIADQDLIRWCEHEPQTRFTALAQAITSFSSAKDGVEAWTSIGLSFLEHAPDPAAVLSHFVAQFKPSSGGSGTLTSILESNSKLLDQLDAFPELQPHIEQEKARLRQRINSERAWEIASERSQNERFE